MASSTAARAVVASPFFSNTQRTLFRCVGMSSVSPLPGVPVMRTARPDSLRWLSGLMEL